MTMNPLPPQAYTKEIMLKAYSWLMGQSNSIKEMATTPDILVSLYLKATRDGDGALDRPSITNFKNELKSLAGLLGELDKAPSIPSTIPMPAIQESPLHRSSSASSQSVHSSLGHSHMGATNAGLINTMSLQNQTTAPPSMVPAATTSTDILGLDACSLAMIREVKESLNLSSDSEALRMIIKVGYTRAKSMLPSNNT